VLFSISSPGLFRLTLALIVFLNHVSRIELGYSAVLIFFMLSGYWIFVMWTAHYSRTRNPYFTFLVSRLWRLLPVFLVGSAIAWSVAIATDDIPLDVKWLHEIVSSLVILGYSSLDWQPNKPAWSLDIETQFYLIAPLIIALISSYRAVVLIASAAFFVTAVMVGADWSVAYYIIFFLIGVAAASAQWKPTRRFAWVALGLTAVAVLVWLTISLRIFPESPAMDGLREWVEIGFALMMIPWTIYTVCQRDTKLSRAFGDLSYLVYLFHEPIYRALDFETATHLDRVLVKSAILGVVLLVSLVVWLGLERPSNRLRSQWVTRRIRSALGEALTQKSAMDDDAGTDAAVVSG
jgi:peptidoglycan/LPS O-acetylase OafA/YrhL